MKSSKHPAAGNAKQQAEVVIRKLDELIAHLRGEIPQLEVPKAKAVFETGAEVLLGLRTVFMHYQNGVEPAMREDH